VSLFGYVSPPTLEEAVAILSSRPEAKLLAGGNKLLLPANRDAIAGSLLVDLRKVPTLTGIEREPDGVRIGAMERIAAIAASEVIGAEFPALAEAAEMIGDAQVRNRATLGGSIAARDAEADLPALMLSLDARFNLLGAQGWRTVSAQDFFNQSGSEDAQRGEVIVSIAIPSLPERTGSAYLKFKHPARLYAICGVAAVVTRANERINSVRVAVTGATPNPTRLTAVERALLDGPVSEEAINSAVENVEASGGFRGDLFASAEYRHHLTKIYTRRALQLAITRAAA
jgi:aerobic carbon-monoxide dehydrogenase medium subunit